MINESMIKIIHEIFGGYRTSIIKRCHKCGKLVDNLDLNYHADVRHNNMTSCQEDLLYESMP